MRNKRKGTTNIMINDKKHDQEKNTNINTYKQTRIRKKNDCAQKYSKKDLEIKLRHKMKKKLSTYEKLPISDTRKE